MSTITEALADIKTTQKRISSKRDFVCQYTLRADNLKDPLEKDGGSSEVIARELQAIADLEKNVVDLRRGIQTANEKTEITIEGETKSIADWLVWRREIAPKQEQFLHHLRTHLRSARDSARRQGYSVWDKPQAEGKPTDLIVNINEKELGAAAEKLTNILGQLDGQLSLKNATVMV